MESRLPSRFGEIRGQSVVELAMVLPLLVVLALVIFDLSRVIQANNIISNMSREGANLASRSTIAPQDIMNSLAPTAQPLAMGTNGAMYITQVTYASNAYTIQLPVSSWGNTANLSSRVSQSNVGNIIGPITTPPGNSVNIFEVIYTYNFMFFPGSTTLYSFTIL